MDPASTTAIGALVDVLKAGGPYALLVIVGLWGWHKDKAKDEQAKEHFHQLVELHKAQTDAMVKMEATFVSLRDVIQSLIIRAK